MPKSKTAVVPIGHVAQSIFILRGQRVILDSDLAMLYGVDTRRLNEQVRRNRERFPADFIFELGAKEFANLKSQSATSSWGGRRKLPLAFTEHGSKFASRDLRAWSRSAAGAPLRNCFSIAFSMNSVLPDEYH